MPLPAGVEKVTVTAGEPLTTFDGALAKGRLYFTGPDLVTIGEDDVVLGGTAEVVLEDGEFSKTLVATDASGMSPSGWTYRVVAALTNGPGWVRYVSLPKASPAVKLADVLVPDPVAGEFTVLVDGSTLLAKTANLADLPSPAVARTSLGLGTAAVQNADAFDPVGAASTAQTTATNTAAADATAKVAAHAVATDPHGDRSWADTKFATQLDLTTLGGTVNNLSTTVAAIDGFLNDALVRVAAIEQGNAFLAGGHYTAPVELVDSAMPGVNPAAGVYLFSTGGVLKTLSPSGEVVSLLPASGSQIRTARVRVTNDDLSGLPEAASWTIVQTSAGTKLQCSIAATAGDRIEVYPNFLYLGSHFLDWVLLDSGGSIAEYATSEGATPPGEGNPGMYPTLTVSKNASAEMFVVGSGHISAGLTTIALAHQGLGTGSGNRVYAHATYPWRLRLENIGPEPA